MRWVFRILGVLVVFILVVVGGLMLLPGERIAEVAATRFTEATGQEMRIEGPVRPSLWPEIGVSTGSIEVDGANGAPMLSAQAVSVGVDPIGLLSGDIRIKGVEIESPEVILDLREAAPAAPGSEEPSSGSAPPEFTLDRLSLTDGTVRIISEDGSETQLTALTLDARLPDLAGPANVEASGAFDGRPLTLTLEAAEAGALIAGGSTAITALVGSGSAEVRFEGQADLGGNANGVLRLNVPDTGAIPELAALPQGLGKESIAVSAELAVSPGGLALADIVAELDQNRITGGADIALDGPRPAINADIALGAFDLSSVDTPADEADPGPGGWSTDPIDVSFLGIADGTIRVSAESLALGTARLGSTAIRTVIDDRRAVSTIERMTAYDGSVAGSLILNGRNGFSTRLDVEGSALAISRLLSELVGYDQLVAAGDLKLDVLGAGPHMDAVMNSLSGQGAFNVGAGELIGLDIVGMIRNLDPSFVGDTRRTIFDEITVSFVVENGVVIYEDLSVLAPLFKASGSGRIGVGGRTLDLRLLPELLGGENSGIRVPLLVQGTWDAPRFNVDFENLIRQGIESQIGQELERQGAEQLGLTVEDGESLEDAVRGKIEDELRKGLGGLLGR
ncbi:MAG: AsmA family protein [Pseudomonadota bacterium]